jgi:2'-5' RNA ligase
VPPRWRLFVGAPLPASTADEMCRRLAPLYGRYADARWSPASKLHLTFVFLGATDPAAVPTIEHVVAQVASGWRPFEVATGEGGGYLGARGGVAWLQLEDGREEAARLARALDDALEAHNYAARAPKPHVTLARRVTKPLLDDVHRIDTRLRARWRVERVVLFRSHTGPGSAAYEELSAFEFQD